MSPDNPNLISFSRTRWKNLHFCLCAERTLVEVIFLRRMKLLGRASIVEQDINCKKWLPAENWAPCCSSVGANYKKNRATCEVQRLDMLGYRLGNTMITE